MELEGQTGKKLQEINDASSKSAADALQMMINKQVDVSYPSAGVKDLNILDKLNSSPDCILGICDISGDLKGNLLLHYSKEKALPILELCLAQEKGSLQNVTDDAKSAFMELVNIIGGAYLSSMANQLQLKLFPNPPKFAGSVTEIDPGLIDNIKKNVDNIFMVSTELKISDLQAFGDLMILLEGSSLQEIIKKLKN